ncbi:hypothetical protein B0H63DRAFT_556722 [Podospora didyma]|uniref:Protein kinase domain-containing protein n=1 Tax=Podospora didyma TaxID=330526 RepID=A0AAE0NXS1_9PEZI|nr:hypothetical protein B0H63DRAFT_556722 [Podospora didyma]
MGFFDNLEDEELGKRFLAFPVINSTRVWDAESGQSIKTLYRIVHDFDQRRTLTVFTATREDAEDKQFVLEALDKIVDTPKIAQPDVIAITLSEKGTLRSFSTNMDHDHTMIPCYSLIQDFHALLPNPPTIRRSDLTEVDRLGIQADHVTYTPQLGQPPKHVAFKYYFTEIHRDSFWLEISTLIQIPRHPNIVPFDRLVVETVGDKEKVLGLTTPFCGGDTIDEQPSVVFTLAHLTQLLEAIDYLNLTLGIVHGDIRTHNLIRTDVHYAVITVFDIITRQAAERFDGLFLHEVNRADILSLEKWEKHPSVALDSDHPGDTEPYRQALKAWVEKRDAIDEKNFILTHPIKWIPRPEFPEVYHFGSMQRVGAQMRQVIEPRGDPFPKWHRPPSRHLPLQTGKVLLATGEVVGQRRSERQLGKK